jgi:hypothetical protein
MAIAFPLLAFLHMPWRSGRLVADHLRPVAIRPSLVSDRDHGLFRLHRGPVGRGHAASVEPQFAAAGALPAFRRHRKTSARSTRNAVMPRPRLPVSRSRKR